ncbi:hypothetical protein SDC9_195923 [bioreactor metagenome]|uniref:Uncharacterized protein n=1 Tax=bioreactor metagenome TaxID=1076179 RepID=A0A645IBL1_9ZZZZ
MAAGALAGLLAHLGQTFGGEGTHQPGLFQGGLEAGQTHRLEQVIHRIEVEGLDGVAVVGGGKDHRRRPRQAGQVAGQLREIKPLRRIFEELYSGYCACVKGLVTE